MWTTAAIPPRSDAGGIDVAAKCAPDGFDYVRVRLPAARAVPPRTYRPDCISIMATRSRVIAARARPQIGCSSTSTPIEEESTLVNRRLAYVAVSRGRYDAQIYTNDTAGLITAVDRDVGHPSPVEITAVSEARRSQRTQARSAPGL